MSVHLLFAENLRREVSRFRTIAEVCEGIGINRQQFNKYLAGSSLPSSATLRKICGFLRVREQDLFASANDREPLTNPLSLRAKNKSQNPFAFLTLNSQHYDFKVEKLLEGFYFCYFPMPNVPGMIIRSLVTIQRSADLTSFVRVSGFSHTNRAARSLAKGRHSGTVFSGQTEYYFLSCNRFPPFQVSLMTIEKTNETGQHFFVGVTLTRDSNHTIGVRTCLMHCGDGVPIREIMSKLGMIHEADPSVDPAILFALHR